MLKFKTVTLNKINFSDLEAFVRDTYGDKDYSFACVQECGNDTSHKFCRVLGKIDKYDEADAAAIRAGNVKSYRNYLLFEVLVADGHLPPGDYLVEVCW